LFVFDVFRIDGEDKLRTQIEYAGQRRNITIINYSALYSLMLSFKRLNIISNFVARRQNHIAISAIWF